MVEMKFCGITRAEDAALAAAAGATYVGVVFAGGPRRVTEATADRVFDALPPGIRRAAVFAKQEPREIARLAVRLHLDVVQLHADPQASDVEAMRAIWPDGEIWAAVRIVGSDLPAHTAEMFEAADGVVVDARVERVLGGAGVPLPWETLAAAVTHVRRGARLVVAGGLRSDNVRAAVRALSPDVVDVSSGIESAVGIKNSERMRAFRDAVLSAEKQP